MKIAYVNYQTMRNRGARQMFCGQCDASMFWVWSVSPEDSRRDTTPGIYRVCVECGDAELLEESLLRLR